MFAAQVLVHVHAWDFHDHRRPAHGKFAARILRGAGRALGRQAVDLAALRHRHLAKSRVSSKLISYVCGRVSRSTSIQEALSTHSPPLAGKRKA